MAIVSRADRGEPLPATTTARKTAARAEPPPLAKKLEFALHVYSLRAVLSVPLWYRGWHEYFYPPAGGPDIVKAYECRPRLPVRVFFPRGYDTTSPTLLPTVFSLHGGGFCLGVSRDDDEYNRALADGQSVAVVSLDYTTSSPAFPGAAFPAALHDVEALYHAVLADESLPLARDKLALLGFSAGGNLALALPQLPSVRGTASAPAAAISVYGCLDLSRDTLAKLRTRYYKPALPLPQGSRIDALAGLGPALDWAYVPYGHDLADPLLSPAFAARDALPAHVYLVAAELDMLAHESWRLACRLANTDGAGQVTLPDPDSKNDRLRCVGRRASSKRKGALEPPGDDRYSWQHTVRDPDDGRATASVNWLLVPDVVHGFDNAGARAAMGSEAVQADAALKTEAYVEQIGTWLHNVVWQ